MPQCSALNKQGQPCKSTSVDPSDGLCAAHGGRLPRATREQAIAIGKLGRQARTAKAEKRRMSARDYAARELERNASVLFRKWAEAGKNGDWQATKALYEASYGRATERVEVDQSAQLRTRTRAELEAELARLAPHLVRGDSEEKRAS